MDRRAFLTTTAAASLLPRAARAAEPLNVVFFLVDDLGWTDIARFGSSFYETPHVDRLLDRGMRFTQAYAACPVCSPTRASILTGKYPVRTGVTDYLGAAQPEQWNRNTPLLPAPYRDRLALGEVTMAEAFKTAGYATFFCGKWHLGPEGWLPTSQGFDVNLGGLDRGGPYGGKKYFSPYGNPHLPDGPEGEHLPDRLATETCRFIEAHRQQPFFCYFSFYSVHTPLMARPDLQRKYEAKAKELDPNADVWGAEGARKVRLRQDHAVYAGMVEAMDQAVGKVVDTVARLGLLQRTAFVFMSDNGGLSTSEGHPTSNLPLRAGKGWLYEGGLREPMGIVAPGVTAPGSVCDTPVISTDFYPTLLDLCGLPLRPQQHVDGASLRPLLSGGELPARPLFWHYPHYGNQGGRPGGAVRVGDYKLIEWYGEPQVELYHLATDIGEQHNLAASQPELVRKLRALHERWRRSTGALMPTPNPAWDPAAQPWS